MSNLTEIDIELVGLVTGKEDKRKMKELIELGHKQIKEAELTAFLRRVFPTLTKKDGMVVWDILENKKLIVNGKDISGTFRYNAACISEVVGKGTDYCDFYCSWVHSPREHKFIKKIERHGGKIKEYKSTLSTGNIEEGRK